MPGRSVRFAPSSGSAADDDAGEAAEVVAAPAAAALPVEEEVTNRGDAPGSTVSSTAASPTEIVPRRPSVQDRSVGSAREALEASLRSNGSSQSAGRRGSERSHGSSHSSGSGTGPLDHGLTGSDRTPLQANVGRTDLKVDAALAANDGPSLAAALASSIRHHSRLIDGEAPLHQGARRVQPAYDPYQDDDHVSLAPNVELNYEKGRPKRRRDEGGAAAAFLRDYVANAGRAHDDTDPGPTDGYERTVEQQQERIERMRDESLTSRFAGNISAWFGLDRSERGDDTFGNRSVRFADGAGDGTDLMAAAIANGETVPGAAYGMVGRAPKFYAPPSSSFRTATRHPSQLPADQFATEAARRAAPRRMLAARKRHRRHDSFLRLAVALFCFSLSLAFAIIYGEGRFGLAVATVAYERKVAGRYDAASSSDRDDDPTLSAEEEPVFYPEWWEREQGIPDMEARGIKFSAMIEYHAADVTAPRAPERIETPFFWFVPRSGGNAIRTIMARCLRLAEASEYGAGIEANYLRIEEQEDRRFVNVDMTSSKGLRHAEDLNLASSGVPDVIISGDIHGVLKVFNNRNRARIFAVLRHPLDRAISKYYADIGSDPDVAGMTLPQYVHSAGNRVENNYLTRYLSGRYGGKLEMKHLDLAREFLRRKFVVGLASDLPATANLFSHVFGWNNTAASLGLENVDVCYSNIYNALSDRSPPSVEEGSEGWKLLVAQNWFDLKVYEYAEHLFRLQVNQLKLTGSTEPQGEVARR